MSLKIHSLATFGKEDAPSLRFSRKYKNGLVLYSIPILYSKSLDKATFDSGKKLCFQDKWCQFIQNEVKFVLVKEFLCHSPC